MRKAGKFDDATVNEITYRIGDAVRKAGVLLEELAPGQGARTDTTSRTGSGSYAATIKEANMGEDTALNWCAASKLGKAGGAAPARAGSSPERVTTALPKPPTIQRTKCGEEHPRAATGLRGAPPPHALPVAVARPAPVHPGAY